MGFLTERGAVADGSAERPPAVMPGYGGFWTLIAADATLFGLLFIQFCVDRMKSVAQYDAAQRGLLVGPGVVNTVVLVTSSWMLALGVRAMHRRQIRVARRMVVVTALLGIVFAVIKIGEYAVEVHSGHTLSSGQFFMYYFLITGIHLLHLMIGVVALVAVAVLMRAGSPAANDHRPLESVAAYWHLIDLLWMFIFPLLYLAR